MEEKESGRKLVACPAYRICAQYGTIRCTCRYDPDTLPPVGMTRQSPEAAWCAPGTVTLILMQAEQAGMGAGWREDRGRADG